MRQGAWTEWVRVAVAYLCFNNERPKLADRLTRAGLTLLLAVGGFGVTIAPAQAEYKYCNNTSYVLKSAIAYKDASTWKSRGWWTLLPGKCRTILPQDLKERAYYTYAESVPGHRGGIKYFAGNIPFCTKEGFFTIEGRDECTTQGYSAGSFVKVEVGKVNTWTTTFKEPAAFSTKKAEIAGVQRLLTDTGYKPGRIDGELGRKTRRAIASFKRSKGIKVGGLISEELITALAEQARSAADENGFNYCNNSDKKLWTAIAFERNKDWVSRGWWMLEPGDCARVIKDTLKEQSYYVYAAFDDENGETIIAGGDHQFCAADVKFGITGRQDCELRGYKQAGFMKVDVGKSAVWTEHFTYEQDSLALSD